MKPMKTKTAAELHIDRLYHYQSFNKPEALDAHVYGRNAISLRLEISMTRGLSAVL